MAVDLGAKTPIGVDDLAPAAAVGRVAAHDLSAVAVRSGCNGSDVSPAAPGDLLVRAGDVLDASRIALLRGLGVTSILCRRRPTATVILVGDVSFNPDGDAAEVALPLLLRTGSAEVTATLRVDADADAVVRTLSGARTDVVVCCGGHAEDGEDQVRMALAALMAEEMLAGPVLGLDASVWLGRLPRIGPGLGERASRIVFGLPGPAADALTAAALLVVPALQAMTGEMRRETAADEG